MTDMNAIDAEAWDRSRVAPGSGMGASARAICFANIREQLIKEGWQPAKDEAIALLAKLYDGKCRTDNQNLVIIRAALDKAREHPAEIVKAAQSTRQGYNFTRELADYILKDVP